MESDRGRDGPPQAGRQRQPHPAPWAARDAFWDQWRGNPDDLWPSVGGSGRSTADESRADRRQRQVHDRIHQAAGRHPDRGRPRLTRDEIVDAAIAVADAEGAEALTMRRIAQVLRSGTMSLYWHVSGKEHLLELMRDMLMAEIEVPEPSGDWRADLHATAVNGRAMLRRHPWLMDFIGARPPLGPGTIANLERSLGILAGLRLTPAAAFDVLIAVNTYVSGVVLRETQEIRAQQAERESGIDVEQALADRMAWRDKLAATGLFPALVEMLDNNVDPDAPETMDERFEFGLECLLDGIAARIGAT